jgi:hypothetical protein
MNSFNVYDALGIVIVLVAAAIAFFARPRRQITDLDRRRDLEKPEHNPGFNEEARRKTARLCGVDRV